MLPKGVINLLKVAISIPKEGINNLKAVIGRTKAVISRPKAVISSLREPTKRHEVLSRKEVIKGLSRLVVAPNRLAPSINKDLLLPKGASLKRNQPPTKKKGRGGCIVAIFIISLIIAIIVALFSGCKHINLPPDPGTPPPAPHSGCFVHEADTLIFNGDGKTIVWHFDREVSGIGNQGEGQYVFLFDHGKCRYDVAEDFRIIKTEEPEGLL